MIIVSILCLYNWNYKKKTTIEYFNVYRFASLKSLTINWKNKGKDSFLNNKKKKISM